MSTRRKYDTQFKEDAVKLLISSGRKVKEVAAELAIERSNLGRWRKEYLLKLDEKFTGSDLATSIQALT